MSFRLKMRSGLLATAALSCLLPILSPGRAALAQAAATTAPVPASGTGAGLPAPMRGAWVKGTCAAPEAVLYVTPRSVTTIADGEDVDLYRFASLRETNGWFVGTARGAEAPRTMLKLEGDKLSHAEPGAKLRDDALPGASPVDTWQRCPSIPPGIAASYGEGLAALGALERLEEGCGLPGKTVQTCLETIIAVGDVSGDKLLSPAELARLMRGLTWVLAAQEDGSMPAMSIAMGGSALGGVLAARLLVESLDYDGDGKLSLSELGQDRIALPDGTGSAAGAALRTEGLTQGVALLRSLIEGFTGSED